jgi:hypothetical protein
LNDAPLIGFAQRPKATVEQAGRHQSSRSPMMHTHQKSSDPIATIGLDIGKNTFHLVGLDKRGAIAMRIKVSRHQRPSPRRCNDRP